MTAIRLKGLSKTYNTDESRVLNDINLEIGSGEFLVLVGQSGCGKSTLLRLISGLEMPSDGEIWFDDEEVTHRSARDRNVAMVFQSYALYPHMTVRDNLSFGLRVRRMNIKEIEKKTSQVSEILGLQELLNRKPHQLSGGQRQRVALGRAIIRKPKVFLLDEPLSNLDAGLRVSMRREISAIHKELGVTIVYVTHDQEEAMTLADRLAIIHLGEIQQIGKPLEIYHYPINRFVAEFVGEPKINIVSLPVAESICGVALLGGDGTVAGIRPEQVKVTSPGETSMQFIVESIEELGHQANIYLKGVYLGCPILLTALSQNSCSLQVGSFVSVDVDPEDVRIITEGS